MVTLYTCPLDVNVQHLTFNILLFPISWWQWASLINSFRMIAMIFVVVRMNRRKSDAYAEEEAEFRRALDSVPPPTPPDGGWGWCVVFASFLMNMVVDGVCYNYGVLLPELTERYAAPTSLISMGGALILGTYMFSGKKES